MKINAGDEVIVIAGKDKGARGTVLSVLPDRDRVIVEGVNRMKRHVRKDTTTRGAVVGGIETVEAPIHISNVALVTDGKRTKVGSRREQVNKTRADGTTLETTRGVRVARRTGKDVS
jgi:large subunit ribosomal protein L24